MPSKRTNPTKAKEAKSTKLGKEDLIYLACLFEATLNIRGTNSNSAVAIAATPEWPREMAKTYGGKAETFTANSGKDFVGWYLPVNRRLELWELVQPYLRGMSEADREKTTTKLTKAVNSAKF